MKRRIPYPRAKIQYADGSSISEWVTCSIKRDEIMTVSECGKFLIIESIKENSDGDV